MDKMVCERRRYSASPYTHSHEFAQLILPLQGELHISADRQDISVDDASAAFLYPHCIHEFSSDRCNEFLVMDIPQCMLRRYADMGSQVKRLSMDERWKAIRLLMLNDLGSGSGKGSFESLFNYFYTYIMHEDIPASIAYIDRNYSEDLQIDELARIEHYSPNYYSEWFKLVMKVTPSEYIQAVRIDKARELLESTGLSIMQIAQEVGYSSQASFSRIFKTVTGATPMQYRNSSLFRQKTT